MKRPIPNWLLSLASIVLFLAVLEGALAFFWPHKIIKHPYHEQYHPVLGWANKPNVRGEVHLSRSLAFHRTHNGQGLRSLREVGREKPAGVTRVLLLGDSFFWGFGVDDGDIISEVLQRKAGAGTEILNGSVTGYGTDQELLWLAEEGLKYRPDVVVLGFFPTNDLDEITNSVMYGYPKPYFTQEGVRLQVHNVPVPDTRETRRKAFDSPDTAFGKFKKFLRHHTHTYPFIAGRLNSVPALRQLFLELGLAEEFTWDLPGVTAWQLDAERAPDLADALILEMRRLCRENGARFLLVHIPRRERGPAGTEETVYGMGARSWNDQASRHLTAFALKHHIDFLDFLPVVRRREAAGEVVYNRLAEDHHWTALGHAAAAEALERWLRQDGILPAP